MPRELPKRTKTTPSDSLGVPKESKESTKNDVKAPESLDARNRRIRPGRHGNGSPPPLLNQIKTEAKPEVTELLKQEKSPG